MIIVLSGLYKERRKMLNSGALLVAPHNRVNADATNSAPRQKHLIRARLDAGGINRGSSQRSGAHDAERSFERTPFAGAHGVAPLARANASPEAGWRRHTLAAGVPLNFFR